MLDFDPIVDIQFKAYVVQKRPDSAYAMAVTTRWRERVQVQEANR
ncbi:hypothetical protein [Trinickia symbiotica]|nr:hypothetical protein [Trinickia symbiotica]